MKNNNGFTLFEVVITLLVIFVIGTYVLPVVGSPLFYYNKPIEELQEVINLKLIIENITHDYTYHCFADNTGTKFNLEKLRVRIGRTGHTVENAGFAPDYYPYGHCGDKYIRYYVEFNEFIKEYSEDDTNKTEINFVRDYPPYDELSMLLVTIKLDESSEKSLTVLFTEKQKE